MDNYEFITIYSIGAGKDGQGTLRFSNVTNFEWRANNLIGFDYVSASTGLKNNAIFSLNNISGISFPE